MFRNYVFAGLKFFELFFDIKFLLFCRKVHFYSFNSQDIDIFFISLFCKLTFKKAYFRRFSFDDYSIDGIHPYVYCRQLASNILFDDMDFNKSRSLTAYLSLLSSKSQQLPLESLLKHVIFAHLIAKNHPLSTIFPVQCDYRSFNLIRHKPLHHLNANNISIRYNISYANTFFRFLASFYRLIVIICRGTFNSCRNNDHDSVLSSCNVESKNIIFSFEGLVRNQGYRSVYNLSVPYSPNFPGKEPYLFFLLGSHTASHSDSDIFQISFFYNIFGCSGLQRIFHFYLAIYRSLTDSCQFSLSLITRSLLFSLDAIEALSLLGYFNKLEHIYFYDEHRLIRGLILLSFLDQSFSHLRFHQIQYSVLPFANPIMMQMVDYFHCFEPHFIKSFIHPKIPPPTILNEDYPFLLPNQSISTHYSQSLNPKFLIGYLDESIQFDDMFAGISFESELLVFEELARFLLSRDNYFLCFKPQFARNSVRVLFDNNSYLNLLVKQNKLFEFQSESATKNSRNNLLPSFAFKDVDLCIGSCIGGTAAYECGQSGKRSVLIHSNHIHTPFINYPFRGQVIFPDIKSVLSILSSFRSKHEFLSSNLGLW